ncbi:Neuropeptide receptor 10 [Aphelenchoides fujianensis]|nr:Neuropeptide receptor 10 [Aphelenchoides fujianensis]
MEAEEAILEAAVSLNETDGGQCADIKLYLWETAKDLTSLPSNYGHLRGPLLSTYHRSNYPKERAIRGTQSSALVKAKRAGVSRESRTSKLLSLLITPQKREAVMSLEDDRRDQTDVCYTRKFDPFCFSLGVLGNSLVIASVYRHKSLQSTRNIFIVSLSCSDIIVSLVSSVFTPISAFTKIWLFGKALCRLVPVIQGTSLCFSTLTLTSIAIDRFVLIIFPTKRSIQMRQAFQIIFVNLLIAVCTSLPMFFKQKLVNYSNFCGQFCAEEWGDDSIGRKNYGTIVFVIQFLLPILCISFCYSMIYIRLGKGMLMKSRGSDPSQSTPVIQSDQRRAASKRRMRTNKMLISMVAVFLACWTPTVVFNGLRDFDALPSFVLKQEYLWGISTVSRSLALRSHQLCPLLQHFIAMSSTIWNVFLYATNESFRYAFAEYLHFFSGKGRLVRGQSSHRELDSACSSVPHKNRLGTRLSERGSVAITGVVLDHRRDPHIVRTNSTLNTQTSRSSMQGVRSNTHDSMDLPSSRDSVQWNAEDSSRRQSARLLENAENNDSQI